MSATRYMFVNPAGQEAAMVEEPCGAYVAHSDYLAACRDAVAMARKLQILNEIDIRRKMLGRPEHEIAAEILANGLDQDAQRVIEAYKGIE